MHRDIIPVVITKEKISTGGIDGRIHCWMFSSVVTRMDGFPKFNIPKNSSSVRSYATQIKAHSSPF
jgi:hypothetical protein